MINGSDQSHLNVLLSRANCVDPAGVTGKASDSTLVGVANLLPGAIFVRLALDRLASRVPPAEQQVARFATLRLADVVLHASLVLEAIVVRRATQFLHADVVVAVLVLGATGVALAGRLAEAVDAQLVAYAISRATAQRWNRKTESVKFRFEG